MSDLHQISVRLSKRQNRKIARALKNNEEVRIRLSKNALSGNDVLMVPMNTVKKLEKNKRAGKGIQITISKANIRKQTGEGIFSSLLPVVKSVAPTIGKTIGLSSLAGLSSEGASQLMKKNWGSTISN